MAKEPVVVGVVEEVLPANLYRVTIPVVGQVIAHISGKMRFNHINVLLGDRVEVWLDPYQGKTSNRISKRL